MGGASTQWAGLREHPPADGVASGLGVEDERPDRVRQLVALPLALAAGGGLAVVTSRGGGGPSCLDRVGGCAEVVFGDMWDAGCLARSIRRETGCPAQRSGGPHRVPTGCPGLHHGELARSPGPSAGDRVPGPEITRTFGLEQVKDVLGTGGCPQRQEVMIRVGQEPATTDRHEARVSHLREDHGSGPLRTGGGCQVDVRVGGALTPLGRAAWCKP